MSNTILSGSREPHQSPILLDLNALYHPPKQPLTALGIVSALVPLFGYGWQAMTQDPETHFRQELGKRINKRKTDEANLAPSTKFFCTVLMAFSTKVVRS